MKGIPLYPKNLTTHCVLKTLFLDFISKDSMMWLPCFLIFTSYSHGGVGPTSKILRVRSLSWKRVMRNIHTHTTTHTHIYIFFNFLVLISILTPQKDSEVPLSFKQLVNLSKVCIESIAVFLKILCSLTLFSKCKAFKVCLYGRGNAACVIYKERG